MASNQYNNILIHLGATSEFADGFVGCIRAFVLNGVPVDLVHEVTKNAWGLYGVGVGCQGKCTSNPCQNGGVCKEGYDSFTCDCRSVEQQPQVLTFFIRKNQI